MDNQFSNETKQRIKQLRLYRNIEVLKVYNFVAYVVANYFGYYNRDLDKFDILNIKIKNLKNGLNEDEGIDLENYYEPGINDNPKLFPNLNQKQKFIKNKNC